jgi:hypothetical protein
MRLRLGMRRQIYLGGFPKIDSVGKKCHQIKSKEKDVGIQVCIVWPLSLKD